MARSVLVLRIQRAHDNRPRRHGSPEPCLKCHGEQIKWRAVSHVSLLCEERALVVAGIAPDGDSNIGREARVLDWGNLDVGYPAVFIFVVLFATHYFGNSQSRTDTDTEPRRLERKDSPSSQPTAIAAPRSELGPPVAVLHSEPAECCGVPRVRVPHVRISAPPHPRCGGPRGCRCVCAQLRHPFYDISVTPAQRVSLPFPPRRELASLTGPGLTPDSASSPSIGLY